MSEVDLDVEPLSRRPVMYSAPDVEVEEVDDFDIEEVSAPRDSMGSAPNLVVVDDELEAVEEVIDADSVDARAHVRKAMVDAESFRGLRLYSKAIETLRIALGIDPRSVNLREKLRDVLSEAGDRDAAIGEMITLAAIHLDTGDHHKAEAELYQVLELEPEHATACEMLEQLGGFANDTSPGYVEEYSEDAYTQPDHYDDPVGRWGGATMRRSPRTISKRSRPKPRWPMRSSPPCWTRSRWTIPRSFTGRRPPAELSAQSRRGTRATLGE